MYTFDIHTISDKFFNEWVTENNGKRVLSKYYQYQVSQIMYGLLKVWGYKPDSKIYQLCNRVPNTGVMDIMGYKVKVLILDEMNHEKREYLIRKFLQL